MLPRKPHNVALMCCMAIVMVLGMAIQAWTQGPFVYTMSSGLFGLPAAAQSVDWTVINDSNKSQTFRVTVYRAGVGMKTVVAPGALTFTLSPNETTHNGNSVGDDNQPFIRGFFYEVVVETNSLLVLPSVEVWQDHAATVIPGTRIGPQDFSRGLNERPSPPVNTP